MTEEGECGVDGDCYDNEIPRLRFASLGMTYGWRGWVPASGRTTGGGGFLPASSWGQALRGGYGDGSPHARGQREGVDSCLRLHGGRLFAGGTGMGPRMREDNGRGWILACVFMGAGSSRGVRGWVPACARTMGGDGFLLASLRGWDLCGGVRGWVPACASTTGGGWVPACARTTVGGWILACVFMGVGPVREGTGMGPRMREENGWGWK